MLGDVCDADELDTGLRREGIYSASMEFGKKVAIGLSTLLSGYLISVTGFDQKLSMQSDDTLLAMRIGYILVIGVTLGLAFLCIWFYPLTHAKTSEVRRLLDIKRG